MDTKKSHWSRRDILRFGGTTGAILLCRPFYALAADPVAEVDHIIWAVSDLDKGIAFIEEKTGVRAVIGGVHPGRGTRNALISLGERRYLEILSTDPAQPDAKNQNVDFVKSLTEPRILGWAAGTRDIAAVEKGIRDAKIEMMGPEPGSRNKPDGTTLKWKSMYVGGHDGTVVPFVIEWSKDSTHPSEDSPKGATLRKLQLVHPKPGDVNPFLEAMGLSIRATKGPQPKITAVLDSPKGQVVLT
jgi:hypothetical protein